MHFANESLGRSCFKIACHSGCGCIVFVMRGMTKFALGGWGGVFHFVFISGAAAIAQ
jgi:hypothetical protein